MKTKLENQKRFTKQQKEKVDQRLLLTSDVSFYISIDDEREVLQGLDSLQSNSSLNAME